MHALTHVIPAALRQLLGNAPLSPGKVAFAWRAAVGPAFDRATEVRLEGTTLIVETTSVEWTRELRRSSTTILHRLQELLGVATVASIEVRTHPRA